MKSKSILKKMAALAIVLALVMSVTGMALADNDRGGGPNRPRKATVSFDWNGGTSSLLSVEFDVQDRNGNYPYIWVQLPTSADGAFEGYELTGWKIGQDVKNPGDTVKVYIRWERNAWSSVTATAQWSQVIDTYILHYDITSTFEGQPADPADEAGSAPITPNAVVTMDGYYFTGWTTPEYVKTATETSQVDGVTVIRNYYEGTATGFFTLMEVVEATAYNLIYTGSYMEGALFWPANVIGAPLPPALAGNPYRAGYIFSGWKPGVLDWSKVQGVVTFDVITPEEGAPYVRKTTSYTITVQGGFTAEPTSSQDIPLEAPQTGAFGWSGIAGGLAVLSSLGVALVARRRKDS